jgi:hypothetical protein
LPSLEVGNPATRQAMAEELRGRLTGALADARVLVGFDFPLGDP